MSYSPYTWKTPKEGMCWGKVPLQMNFTYFVNCKCKASLVNAKGEPVCGRHRDREKKEPTQAKKNWNMAMYLAGLRIRAQRRKEREEKRMKKNEN